jgi:site-specific recombinase XerD
MGRTKYPVLDEDFYLKMLGVCADDEDRGMIAILDLTGMHVSSLCELGPENLIKQGPNRYIRWVRPKTNRNLQALVPPDRIQVIETFLKKRRKTRQYYHFLVKKIGERAGYEDISPMTFRHNRCLRALGREQMPLFAVPQVMGCSLDVVVRNYSKLHEDDIARAREGGSIFKRRKGLGGIFHSGR